MENKKLSNVDLESTDYDPAQVGNLDRRLEVGKKDAVFFHVLGVVATVIATIWMYAFGTGDPAEMRYFLGMPMWVSGCNRDLSGHVCGGHDLAGQMGGVSADRKV